VEELLHKGRIQDIVRAGILRCFRKIRPRARLGLGRMGPMTEAAAQEEIRRIIRDLETIRTRLLEVHEDLPPPPRENATADDPEEVDVTTEVRSVIECVLADSLRPAIRDLHAAAEYRPGGKRK
jgi:hypothetical protein